MEFWTIMWITVLSGYLEGSLIAVPYETLEQCEAALQPVSNTLPYDHNILCEETDVLSSSLRPKRRPEGLTQ